MHIRKGIRGRHRKMIIQKAMSGNGTEIMFIGKGITGTQKK